LKDWTRGFESVFFFSLFPSVWYIRWGMAWKKNKVARWGERKFEVNHSACERNWTYDASRMACLGALQCVAFSFMAWWASATAWWAWALSVESPAARADFYYTFCFRWKLSEIKGRKIGMSHVTLRRAHKNEVFHREQRINNIGIVFLKIA
jgi:hypothetical protein